MSRPAPAEAARSPARAAATVAQLYRDHAATALTLALRYGRGDRGWAEDVVHDVFLEVHRHVERLAEMENPGAWIYRAVASRSLNRLRRDRWLASPLVRWVLARPASTSNSPEAVGLARSELDGLFALVNRLPDAQRMCFWMRHVDGMTQPEIGEVLGFRKSYVCKLLQRAEAAVAQARGESDDE